MIRMNKIKPLLSACAKLGALGLLFGFEAHADGAPSPINSGDVAWILTSTALVLFMTPGLAFFYGGFVRSKNALATIMQSFIAMAVISVVWFVCGYSLAFGPTQGGFIGSFAWAFLSGVGGAPNADYGATIPHSLFMIYQCMFAVITPALICGAFAERLKFSAYLAFITLWSLLVYSPVAHWVWDVGGFLHKDGILDFAGGNVVHQTAGFSALAAAFVLGRRKDYGKTEYIPHNIPFIVLGACILWFGWFGFNGGSAIASNELATSAFVATHMAAAAAAVVWIILDRIVKGKPTVVGASIGAVVGLVSVTPASGFVTPASAILIGIVASTISFFVVLARGKSQLDDSLDVFACHGVGGLVGALMTGILASKLVNAAGADGGFSQLMIQVKGCLIVDVYSFAVTFGLLKLLDGVLGLRPDASSEEKGLDLTEHGEKAYQT